MKDTGKDNGNSKKRKWEPKDHIKLTALEQQKNQIEQERQTKRAKIEQEKEARAIRAERRGGDQEEPKKLTALERQQEQIAQERQATQARIEQQEEERDSRAQRRAADNTEKYLPQAEKNLQLQRTKLSEKLSSFQADMRKLENFIASNNLTGEISSTTNQLIKNARDLIGDANRIINGYRIFYKQLDTTQYYRYDLPSAKIAADNKKGLISANEKEDRLRDIHNGVNNLKQQAFENHIRQHQEILSKLNKASKQLSK